MRWLAPVRAALRNLAVIWRGQSGFGRLLMVIGAVNVSACLILGLGLVAFSALPWRGALVGPRVALRVPTTAPTRPRPTPVPSLTPSPTLSPTPTPVPTRTRTPSPTRRPTEQAAGDVEVTARLSDRTPSRNSRVTVYGRITSDGRGVEGVPMQATWRIGSSTSTCNDESDRSGQASCALRIGNVKKGTEGTVQVVFSYQGRTYTDTVSFTVR